MTSPTLPSTDFHHLVRTELGLPLTDAQFAADFDELPDWDSLLLLKLVVLLERATGRRIAVSRLLEARSLQEIYDEVVTP
ncbi:phosphopantetheine-binding protein [Streptomyces sp. S.PB5]|uniref:phosphopantetheine-binding protein n=1 Tax=Streptomyces sp. S.PB5 TaxID=3020844 RepID=UPI0025B1674E|nr:phosphopantetheine-binding protein [Streptomyces sp. S.PB5]MDN3022221.1 phosphopantetheine-binding protein [Streptomyces sp. S.PB5]